jgi:hypothetical protein
MNVCIVKEDKVVMIDGEGMNFDFDLPSNVWAIQWNGTSGEIEFNDGTPNEAITDFSAYQSIVDAYNAEKLRLQTIEDNKLVGFAELRGVRDGLLKDSDYTMLSDYTGTDVAEWVTYRQALRDLPDGYEPVKNVTYPIKPGSL